jgi:serine/threonine protein phosphatase PrpC
MEKPSPEMLVIPPPIPSSDRGFRLNRPAEQKAVDVEIADEDVVPEEEETEIGTEDMEFVRQPGELQEAAVVPAFEVNGFKKTEVAVTLEKKDERKDLPEDSAEMRNQDNVIADPESGLLGVLDGLGGEGKGDLASKSAERAIPESYKRALKRNLALSPADVQRQLVEHQLAKLGATDIGVVTKQRKDLTAMAEHLLSFDPVMARKSLSLLESFRDAHEAVLESGGKTTACAGFIHEAKDGKRWLVAASVGDSGAYLRRANGEVVPLTKEDSLLNCLQDAGFLSPDLLTQMKGEPDKDFSIPISERLAVALGADADVAKQLAKTGITYTYHKMKASMVASLGSKLSLPSLTFVPLKTGDEVYFGTDGLVDKFEDPKTEETDLGALSKEASRGKTLVERVNALREAAKKRKTYKKDDDVAIVAARAV